MGPMSNETHRGKGARGTWLIRPTGGMGYRGMEHMGNRPQWVQGYGVQGVWAG